LALVVIGGGAAGMMAAGTAANRGIETILIEKNSRLGKKVLITGKGRCNITNATSVKGLLDNVLVNPNFLYSAFYSFPSEQLIYFLNRLGLKTKIERGNRVFPVSDKAEDVVNTLKKYLKENDVKIIKEKVLKILTKNKVVSGLKLSNGRVIKCDRVILSTGGVSYPSTGSSGDGFEMAKKLGHKIKKLKPSLVPLEIKEDWINKLIGLSLRNIKIRLFKNDEMIYTDFGEMIFTHYGVSGPVILSVSSNIKDNIKNNNYRLEVDMKPALDEDKLDRRIQRDFKKYSRKNFSNALNDLLPQKMIVLIIELSKIPYDKKVNQISKEERKRLVNLLKGLSMTVSRSRPITEAIITSGGVDVNEINPSTMESKLIAGLFFAGEIIDLAAMTGGYNLQIAFSTGYKAGNNLD